MAKIKLGVFVLREVDNTWINRVKIKVWESILPPHIKISMQDTEEEL